MNGLDILGAVSFEEYIVGATTPDETPVLAKLNKAAQRVSRAAAKIPARHGKAAAKLRSLSSTAISKGQKLKAAIARAKAKAQSTLAQPKVTPTVAQMADTRVPPPAPPPARTTSLTSQVTPSVPAPVRAATTYAAPPPPAPTRAAMTYVAPAPTSTRTLTTTRRSVVGLSAAVLASVTDWIRPMLDIYSAFANQLDDAGLAAEVYAQVAPLVDQLTASVPSSPLIASGNAILDQAATIYNSVAPPPDPSVNVGAWIGDFSSQAADLQRQAIDWIKAARNTLATAPAAGTGTTPAAGPTSGAAKISVTPIQTSAVPNQPVQFFAQVADATGKTVTPSTPTTWSVTPATGAMVDQSGSFTASAPGAYTVTATADGFSASGTANVQGGDAGYGGGGSGGGGGGGDSGAYGGDEGVDQSQDDQLADQGDQGYDDQQYADDQGADAGGSVFDTLSEYVQEGREERYADEGDDSGDYPSDDDYATADDEDSGEDAMMSDEDALAVLGELGGGGGHGGGGHGGHHGGRGMRGGYGGGWYGPWYIDSGYDVLLDYDNEDNLADRIAKKVAQQKWAEQLGYTAPETHWYTVATPSAVKDEMDKIMREGNTLEQDINATRTGDPSFPAFKNAWLAFWLAYKKFYDDNATGISGWASRLWSSTGDQIVDYGNQLNDWRARLRQFAGARVTEPAVTSIVRRDDPSATNWKPYVIGFGVLAGVGLVSFGAVKIAAAIAAAHRLARR